MNALAVSACTRALELTWRVNEQVAGVAPRPPVALHILQPIQQRTPSGWDSLCMPMRAGLQRRGGACCLHSQDAATRLPFHGGGELVFAHVVVMLVGAAHHPAAGWRRSRQSHTPAAAPAPPPPFAQLSRCRTRILSRHVLFLLQPPRSHLGALLQAKQVTLVLVLVSEAILDRLDNLYMCLGMPIVHS